MDPSGDSVELETVKTVAEEEDYIAQEVVQDNEGA